MSALMVFSALLLSAPSAAPASCTVRTAFKAAEAPDATPTIAIAKKSVITLLAADTALVSLRTAQNTMLYAPRRALKSACGQAAFKGLPALGGEAAEEGEQSAALRVSRSIDTPEPAVAASPSPPIAVAPPPVEPTPKAPVPSSAPPAPAHASAKTKAGSDKDKIKIAVMDIKISDSMPNELKTALTALVPQTLDELGPFKAVTKQDIDQMLSLEAMKDTIGCSDVSCLAEIGGALGVDFMVSGSIVVLGDTYLTQLQLLNIKTSRPEQRVSREYKGGPQGLLEEMRLASKILVRDLLAARSGSIRFDVSEEGATVRIDGSIVGTTPLKTMSLSGGPHTIVVERERFVRHSEDVNVTENSQTNVKITLLPSEEFKKTYRSNARTIRIVAWSLTALGAVGLGTSVGLFVMNQGQFAKLRTDTTGYNSNSSRAQSDYDALRARQGAVSLIDGLAIASAIVGVASAAVGVSLLVLGDNPSKYDQAETETTVNPTVTLSGSLSGSSFALTF